MIKFARAAGTLSGSRGVPAQCSRWRRTVVEGTMKAIGLAHSYVTLDRFVFYKLQKSSDFQNRCSWVKQRLKEGEGPTDFKNLCEASAESDELLWLLAGCDGLPGFTKMSEVFGH